MMIVLAGCYDLELWRRLLLLSSHGELVKRGRRVTRVRGEHISLLENPVERMERFDTLPLLVRVT